MTPSPIAFDADLDRLARLVDTALRLEARLTPKPGLVDARTQGAHDDMDIRTLQSSASALAPFWNEFVHTGYRLADASDDELRLALRGVGIQAEEAMFAATGGVNTHKGAVFAFGLLLGCAGRRIAHGLPVGVDVCDDVSDLSTPMLVEDLVTSTRPPSTAGEHLYREYGLTGARGQAASGFATAREVGLVVYREAMELFAVQPHLALGPMARDRALLQALLAMLAVNTDTNLAHRGGPDAMAWVAEQAQAVLDAGGTFAPDHLRRLEHLDAALTARRLSPGGTADLLAVTIWLSSLPGSSSALPPGRPA